MLVMRPSLHAQQIDLAVGAGTVSAPSASSASGNYTNQSIGGGLYPAIGGDFVLFKHFGVNGEIAWRASKAEYLGYQPYRPVFYDFNAAWLPSVSKRVQAEVLAGIGGESVRFYGYTSCSYYTGCTNYTSSNHFMGHFGGGLRYYIKGNLFIRPEAHVYLVHNNNEFSSGFAVRYGASIGYSLGGSH
jgi:hypothetical protein